MRGLQRLLIQTVNVQGMLCNPDDGHLAGLQQNICVETGSSSTSSGDPIIVQASFPNSLIYERLTATDVKK